MSYEITLTDWLPPSDDVAWDRVRLEFSQTGEPLGGDWQPDAPQGIPVDATPQTPDLIAEITSSNFPWLEGWVRTVFLHPDDSESLPSAAIYTMIAFNGGLLAVVPRARRALEGFANSLEDTQVLALVADAVAEILFYAPQWGKTLVVTDRDVNNVPTAFEVTPELTLPEQTVIVAQAALNHFFFVSGGGTTAERIADEGETWEIQKSAQLLVEQLRNLKKARDEALKQLEEDDVLIAEGFVSFIAVRDAETSRNIEAYHWPGNAGGLQMDYRFGAPC